MTSEPLVAGIIRRDRAVITTCIVLITVLAWAYLVRLHSQMSSSAVSESVMAKMGMVIDAPWGALDVFFTFLMWSAMMVGMMTPTAAPVLLLFSSLERRRAENHSRFIVPLFALGYITIWIGFSAAAALAQWALHQAALLSPGMATSSPVLAGAILIAAGAYQLTPTKGTCLRQCQSPLGFLMSSWRGGPKGAFQMGFKHGVYCLGCCWAIMLLLFAVGVMNLAWVAVLTAFILLEKLGRKGAWLARAGGAVMISFGLVILAT